MSRVFKSYRLAWARESEVVEVFLRRVFICVERILNVQNAEFLRQACGIRARVTCFSRAWKEYSYLMYSM